MHKIKTIIIATILSAFTVFAVSAAELGLTAGVNVKGVSLDAKGSESTSDQNREETLEAIVGSIFLELSMGPVALGVEAIPYDIQGERVTNNRDGQTVDTGSNTVQVDLESNVGAYVLLDLGDTGAYAKLGATYSEVITNENMGASGSSYPNDELIGYHVSLGIEKELGNVSYRLEGTLSGYDDVVVPGKEEEGGSANTVTVSG